MAPMYRQKFLSIFLNRIKWKKLIPRYCSFNAQAIMGGVAGFWGGVFSMGSIYLLMVFAKRVFNPEEGEEKGGSWSKGTLWNSSKIIGIFWGKIVAKTFILLQNTFTLVFNASTGRRRVRLCAVWDDAEWDFASFGMTQSETSRRLGRRRLRLCGVWDDAAWDFVSS